MVFDSDVDFRIDNLLDIKTPDNELKFKGFAGLVHRDVITICDTFKFIAGLQCEGGKD